MNQIFWLFHELIDRGDLELGPRWSQVILVWIVGWFYWIFLELVEDGSFSLFG